MSFATRLRRQMELPDQVQTEEVRRQIKDGLENSKQCIAPEEIADILVEVFHEDQIYHIKKHL